MKKISGVYKITNKITNEFYIGSSVDIKNRWYKHKVSSTWERYPNVRLYQSMAQYGLNNFIFEIVEETSNIHEREQYYIDLLKPDYNDRRANGCDFERYKEYRQTENYKESHRKSMKRYKNQLCLYEGEILKLNALSLRFYKQGMPHSTLEAKKYLVEANNNEKGDLNCAEDL